MISFIMLLRKEKDLLNGIKGHFEVIGFICYYNVSFGKAEEFHKILMKVN